MNLQSPQTRTLLLHHWPLDRQRPHMFSQDEFYLTCYPSDLPNALVFPGKSHVDMAQVLQYLPTGWQPDLFIAKVDAFFDLVPRNLAALKCPKVLVLGDTQHGTAPLRNLLRYIQAEPYDFYISDHKRHHLWYFHLSGVAPLYWLPGLISLKPPSVQSLTETFQTPDFNQMHWPGKINLLGQLGHHPYRQAVVDYLHKHQLQGLAQGIAVQDDCFKVYARSLISLNISLNGDLNCRILEVLAAGGFLLTDKLSEESGLDLLLEAGKEYAYFANFDELRDKLVFYKKNPQQAQTIAQAGYRRYTQSYTPAHMQARLERIINGQTIEDRFTRHSIKRIQHCPTKPLTEQRLALYEAVQELHRQLNSVSIWVDLTWETLAVEDFLDLPRLHLTLANHSPAQHKQLSKYLNASGQKQRVKFAQPKQLPEKHQLVITEYGHSALLQRFIKHGFMLILADLPSFQRLRSAQHLPQNKLQIHTLSDSLYRIQMNTEVTQSQPLRVPCAALA